MNSNGVLHLTVDEHGKLSLWDSPSEARSKKKPHEVQIQLSLTTPQIRTVLAAETIAKANKTPAMSLIPDVIRCKRGHGHGSIVAAIACDNNYDSEP